MKCISKSHRIQWNKNEEKKDNLTKIHESPGRRFLEFTNVFQPLVSKCALSWSAFHVIRRYKLERKINKWWLHSCKKNSSIFEKKKNRKLGEWAIIIKVTLQSFYNFLGRYLNYNYWGYKFNLIDNKNSCIHNGSWDASKLKGQKKIVELINFSHKQIFLNKFKWTKKFS